MRYVMFVCGDGTEPEVDLRADQRHHRPLGHRLLAVTHRVLLLPGAERSERVR
jgi:hypothetical protein